MSAGAGEAEGEARNRPAQRRRVLLLTDGLGNGGTERQITLLAQYLPPVWERMVWSLGDGPFAGALRSAGVGLRVRPRSWRWDIAPATDLWRLLVRWRPDVVHAWGWMCAAAAGPVCKLLGIPLIDGTIRSGCVLPHHHMAQPWNSVWASRVIANSRAGLKAYGISPRLGRVVHNGFDPQRLALCTPRAGAAAGPFTVVMTGRMVWEKDFRTFIRAAREVAQSDGERWRFVAVGDGPDRSRLLREAEDLVARGVVEFPSPALEVLDFVRRADAGVLMTHPRIAEGCSNSIMEYLACGLPVVCSAGGGNGELVAAGATGFLIPPADPHELAQKLRWLCSHPEDARVMGLRGKNRLLEEFSVERMVQKTVTVYNEFIPAAGSVDPRP